MLTHLLRIVAVTGFIVLCTLLPFLPGRYDSLAIPLSAMAQLFGIAGWLLVPIGALALWLYAVSRVLPRVRDRASVTSGSPGGIPLYLVIVPVAVLVIQMALAGPAMEFSRSRATSRS